MDTKFDIKPKVQDANTKTTDTKFQPKPLNTVKVQPKVAGK